MCGDCVSRKEVSWVSESSSFCSAETGHRRARLVLSPGPALVASLPVRRPKRILDMGSSWFEPIGCKQRIRSNTECRINRQGDSPMSGEFDSRTNRRKTPPGPQTGGGGADLCTRRKSDTIDQLTTSRRFMREIQASEAKPICLSFSARRINGSNPKTVKAQLRPGIF